MAVTADLKDVKVVLKLAEGSQSITKCNKQATDEGLYAMGKAVATLESQPLEAITKVVESTLIEE